MSSASRRLLHSTRTWSQRESSNYNGNTPPHLYREFDGNSLFGEWLPLLFSYYNVPYYRRLWFSCVHCSTSSLIHILHVYMCIHCSLLLYGMLCCLDERYPEAGEFFELATTADPTSVIAWTMRGTYMYNVCTIICTIHVMSIKNIDSQ